MTVVLTARPLTPAAFAAFGEVADLGLDRAGFVDRLGDRRDAARPQLEFSRIQPRSLPLEARSMERHVFSTQTFVPLDGASYLLLVAPAASDRPDVSSAVAFTARADQAITYAAGTWHFPITPLEREARFAVLTWRAGDQDDQEFVALPSAVEVRGAP